MGGFFFTSLRGFFQPLLRPSPVSNEPRMDSSLEVMIGAFRDMQKHGLYQKGMQDFCEVVVWNMKNECPFGTSPLETYERVVLSMAYELERQKDLKDNEIKAFRAFGMSCAKDLQSVMNDILGQSKTPAALYDTEAYRSLPQSWEV